ncbi:MAG: hypothetical protein ACTSYR_01510 [Candidatus Odinarchaeia archaeon]
MPLGLIVIKWDNRLGGVIESRFLRKAWVPPSLPTTLLSMHFPNMKVDQNAAEYVKTKIGNLRVLSYFMGTKAKRSVALLLDEKEDANAFKEKLIKIAKKITSDLSGYQKKIGRLYQDIFKN